MKDPCYYDPELNPNYQELAEHYATVVLPGRVRKPHDKAKVEVGVQVVERWILARLRNRTFFSLAELNQAIWALLDELNSRPMAHLEQSRRELFETVEQPALQPLPDQPYEFVQHKVARVNIDYHVDFDKHYYSVPHELIHEEVRIRASERLVEIFHKSQVDPVAIHPRSHAPGRYSTRKEHMPPKHQKHLEWSPERFVHWANSIGPQTTAYVQAVWFPAATPSRPIVLAWVCSIWPKATPWKALKPLASRPWRQNCSHTGNSKICSSICQPAPPNLLRRPITPTCAATTITNNQESLSCPSNPYSNASPCCACLLSGQAWKSSSTTPNTPISPSKNALPSWSTSR